MLILTADYFILPPKIVRIPDEVLHALGQDGFFQVVTKSLSHQIRIVQEMAE